MLSDITSKIRIDAMFLTVDLETIFNTKFVGMRMISFITKFHMQPPFCCFLFHKNYLHKLHIISNICYHTPLQDPILSDASVAPMLQVRAPTTLVLPIAEN
jgi:hypothetical protein